MLLFPLQHGLPDLLLFAFPLFMSCTEDMLCMLVAVALIATAVVMVFFSFFSFLRCINTLQLAES
jgi:hypothetical protein